MARPVTMAVRPVRPVIVGAVVLAAGAGAAVLGKRLASKRGGRDFGQMIEQTPEGSPTRWVFDNVTAIRKNTDRILELLEGKPTGRFTEPPVEAPPP